MALAMYPLASTAVKFFQNEINLFLDTLVLQTYVFDNKKSNLRGGQRDISAKTATLRNSGRVKHCTRQV